MTNTTTTTTDTKKPRLRLRKWSPTAHRVLAYLLTQVDTAGNVRSDLTQHELADTMGISRDYTCRVLQFLEAVNVLIVTRDGRRTYYRLSSAVPPNRSTK